jgi:hypothetical protein
MILDSISKLTFIKMFKNINDTFPRALIESRGRNAVLAFRPAGRPFIVRLPMELRGRRNLDAGKIMTN